MVCNSTDIIKVPSLLGISARITTLGDATSQSTLQVLVETHPFHTEVVKGNQHSDSLSVHVASHWDRFIELPAKIVRNCDTLFAHGPCPEKAMRRNSGKLKLASPCSTSALLCAAHVTSTGGSTVNHQIWYRDMTPILF